jgi:hypothetical protein
MKDFEARLAAIEARNKKVELDKAWETSWTRKLAITILTYLVVASYLTVIHKDKPFINAVVPAIGFFLSTLVLKSVKQNWQSNRRLSKRVK